MAKPRLEYIQWKTGGATVRGSLHITRPKGGTWVILCHGFTGHRIGPGYLFMRLSRDLEAAGISSLRFDFRGSGESDGLFKNMTIDSMRADCLSAVRLVRKKYAPERLFLLGHSFGGMIAAICSGEVRADGLVLLSPVADPEGLVRRRKHILNAGPNESGCYENGPHEMSLSFIDCLKEVDPAETMAQGFTGKILLFQGDADASISVNESARYITKAKKAMLDTTYIILKNADHNFSTVSHFKDISGTLLSWVKES